MDRYKSSDYYKSSNLQTSQQYFNKSTTISCITGDMIDDKFKDFSKFTKSVKFDEIKIICESTAQADIFEGLESNQAIQYNLLLVVDQKEIDAIIVSTQNEVKTVLMQFNFCITNVFETDKYDFDLAVFELLEPFDQCFSTDEFIGDIKAHALMILLQKDPNCWAPFAELIKQKTNFEFGWYYS